MLLAQHLSHLLLQGADALLCLAHLAGRFLTQLFPELLPNCIRCNLATSAFRRLIALAYAATRCEQTVIFRHFADGRFAAPAAAPEAGRFHQGMRYP